jgi:hypothetical protein
MFHTEPTTDIAIALIICTAIVCYTAYKIVRHIWE